MLSLLYVPCGGQCFPIFSIIKKDKYLLRIMALAALLDILYSIYAFKIAHYALEQCFRILPIMLKYIAMLHT